MALDPDTCTVYALSLDGKVCKIKTQDAEPVFEVKQLSFPHEEFKSVFPTINFVHGMVVAVAYLKTPKEDDSCPNRLFLMNPDMEVTGTADITLNGAIFCK